MLDRIVSVPDHCLSFYFERIVRNRKAFDQPITASKEMSETVKRLTNV